MKRAVAVGLVSLQFLLLATLVFLPRGSLWPVGGGLLAASIAVGVSGVVIAVMGASGLGQALTASPIPREHATLVTSGVYGVVRNPIYTGLMTAGLGLVMFGASVWHILAWLALVLLLSVKTRWEERMLVTQHADYREYGARVGRFVPGLGRMSPPG
ncbi:MAG: isoprenylcysteine carboxylmethyltransferase family protein [Cryobacterium sp.]